MTGKNFGTRRRLLMGIGGTVGLATIGGGAAICLASDRLIRTFTGHSDFVFSVAFSRDGRAALSGSIDKTLMLWDLATGGVIRTFTEHTDKVSSVAFLLAWRLERLERIPPHALSASYDNTLKLWDWETGEALRTFTGHSGPVYSVAFAPEGRFALSSSEDRTLKLWELATGKELRTFTPAPGAPGLALAHTALSVAFLPDGRTALSGGAEGELKLWEVATGKELQSITVGDSLYAVALSPDGLMALSAIGDGMITSEISTGRELRTFPGHAGQVFAVAFSSDGRTALSGSDDMTVKVWEVATGKELHTFRGHSDRVTSVAFSFDGRTALSGSFDKTLKLWDLTGL